MFRQDNADHRLFVPASGNTFLVGEGSVIGLRPTFSTGSLDLGPIY